jgi:hypothetical protein
VAALGPSWIVLVFPLPCGCPAVPVTAWFRWHRAAVGSTGWRACRRPILRLGGFVLGVAEVIMAEIAARIAAGPAPGGTFREM